MTQKITPNEIYVVEFGALVRTRCEHSLITDEMIHQRVVAANLAAGDFVRVQCLNHEQTAVTHFCEFLVYDRRSEMKRVEVNDREIKNFEDTSFSVMRVTPWTATPAAPVDEAEATREPEMGPHYAKVKHKGGGTWVVESADGATDLATFTKEDGGKEAAEAFLSEQKAAA